MFPLSHAAMHGLYVPSRTKSDLHSTRHKSLPCLSARGAWRLRSSFVQQCNSAVPYLTTRVSKNSTSNYARAHFAARGLLCCFPVCILSHSSFETYLHNGQRHALHRSRHHTCSSAKSPRGPYRTSTCVGEYTGICDTWVKGGRGAVRGSRGSCSGAWWGWRHKWWGKSPPVLSHQSSNARARVRRRYVRQQRKSITMSCAV